MPSFFIYLTGVKPALQYGLIGYPLSHSFSPGYFKSKFEREGIDAAYIAFPLKSIEELPTLLQTSQLQGLNVTIPYKQAVIPYLDKMDEAALAVGAVNCIDIRNGKTCGYNTDVTSFRQSLEPLLQPQHTHALVLGTGGASQAVKYVLEQLGIGYKTISRSRKEGTITYDELTEEIVAAHTLFINTTPLGMHPDTEAFPPLPYGGVSNQHLFYDLIYNPAETRFLSIGRQHRAAIKNGLEMLHLQAEASWEIWNR